MLHREKNKISRYFVRNVKLIICDPLPVPKLLTTFWQPSLYREGEHALLIEKSIQFLELKLNILVTN
jgi:hypothetical protein